MAYCSTCGRRLEDDDPCPDCAATAAGGVEGIPAPERARIVDEAGIAAAAAAGLNAPSFGRRLLSDPVSSLAGIWSGGRLTQAWVAVIWICLARVLETFLFEIIWMVRLGRPFFWSVLPSVARTLLSPLPSLGALALGALVLASVARKAPTAEKAAFRPAFATLGAAALPYAAALTVGIFVRLASYATSELIPATNALSLTLAFYPAAVVVPLFFAAALLALSACRSAAGVADERRFAVGGVLVLLAMGCASAALQVFTQLLLP